MSVLLLTYLLLGDMIAEQQNIFSPEEYVLAVVMGGQGTTYQMEYYSCGNFHNRKISISDCFYENNNYEYSEVLNVNYAIKHVQVKVLIKMSIHSISNVAFAYNSYLSVR